MGSKQSAPTPPSTSGTAAESIQAQIDALPKILAAQKQYGGQFTEEEIRLLQQYGPQAAAAQRQVEGVLSPESISGSNLLNKYLQEDVSLRPGNPLYDQTQADLRAATSARGLGESGFGALEEVRGLADLRNNLKMQQLQIALSAAGRLPTGLTGTMGGTAYGTQAQIQNVNPSQIFGLAQSNYAQQMGAYQKKGSGIAGALGGGMAGVIGGASLFAAPFTGGASTLIPLALGGAGMAGGYFGSQQ